MRTYGSASNTGILITGNNTNTLFATFPDTGASYEYVIYRPLANSLKHWKKITRISTTDMTLSNLVISVPHYFDAVDALGNTQSFAPRTDGLDDLYRKRPNNGQYTLEVEATVPQQMDNFLNVITPKDSGQPKPNTVLLE